MKKLSKQLINSIIVLIVTYLHMIIVANLILAPVVGKEAVYKFFEVLLIGCFIISAIFCYKTRLFLSVNEEKSK